MKVETIEDEDKIKEQVIEKPGLENNRNYPLYLVMEIWGQIEGNNSISISYYRV